MSTISNAYDKIITRLSTILPSHTRLTNPYAPEQNIERTLTQGYGLVMGSGERVPREIGCSNRYFVRRDFIVVLARKFFAKELNVEAKASVEKQLTEDLNLLVKDFENSVDLNENQVFDFTYVGDGGIESVFADKDNFLMIRATFRIEYHENLT